MTCESLDETNEETPTPQILLRKSGQDYQNVEAALPSEIHQ